MDRRPNPGYLSRVDEHHRTSDQTDLEEVCYEVARDAAEVHRARTVVVRAITKVREGHWDREQIRQVLSILLAAALRQSPVEGVVQVLLSEAGHSGEFLRLEIRADRFDVGDTDLKRLRDFFGRGPAPLEDQEDVDPAFHLADRLARSQDGRIDVIAGETTFSFVLRMVRDRRLPGSERRDH